jgi:hypothetical protein
MHALVAKVSLCKCIRQQWNFECTNQWLQQGQTDIYFLEQSSNYYELDTIIIPAQ